MTITKNRQQFFSLLHTFTILVTKLLNSTDYIYNITIFLVDLTDAKKNKCYFYILKLFNLTKNENKKH